MWKECNLGLYITVDEMMSIIDDALTHGFEFKVENQTIYYRHV